MATAVKAKEVKEEIAIEDMPLNSLKDYMAYNARASRMNKEAKMKNKDLKEGIYEILQCPIELHPKQTVVFNRKDQPKNPLPVYLSNDMIEFKKVLVPGRTYELPVCVLEYLSEKGTPIWEWVDKPDGSKETKKTGKDYRFSLRTVYNG